jgi:hypothetical protein
VQGTMVNMQLILRFFLDMIGQLSDKMYVQTRDEQLEAGWVPLN